MADDKKRDDYTVEMGERNGNTFEPPKTSRPAPASASVTAITNNPIFAILAYCGSSILMTVTNKFVLSGLDFNLNFFLLCVQVRRRPSAFRYDADSCPVGGVRCCDSDVQNSRTHILSRFPYR